MQEMMSPIVAPDVDIATISSAFSDDKFGIMAVLNGSALTHCGPVTPYGGRDLGQHCFG